MGKKKKQGRLLLVEDEAVIALSESEDLKEKGYEVLIANSGEEAVEIIGSGHEIDIILMDIDLGSGIDGTEAAEKILEIKKIPIVFLSSHDEEEIVEKAEKISSYGYLLKNSGINIINASIKIALNLFARNSELKENQRELINANKKLEIANLELGRNQRKIDDREKMLLAAEKKNSALMKAIPDIIFICDLNGVLIDFHTNNRESLLIPPEEFLGKKISDIFPENISSEAMKCIELTVETGELQGMEYSLEINGENRFFEARISSYEDRIFLIIRDLTEKECLEERYKTFIKEFSGIAFQGIVGQGLNFLHGSVEEITGYHESDLKDTREKWIRIVHEEDKPLIVELLERIKEGVSRREECEIRIVTAQGVMKWGHLMIQNILCPVIGKIMVQGTFYDITDRKIAEESLKRNQMMLSQAEKLSKVGSFERDLVSDILWWSDEFYKIFRRERSEKTLVHDMAIDKYVVGDKEGLRSKFKGLVSEGVPINEEFKIGFDDGEYKYIKLHAFGKKDSSGNVIGTYGCCQDITELKETENFLSKTLKQNQELLRELQHRAKNSFSMVYSMIKLMADTEVSGDVSSKLNEIAVRIKAVSEMYDLLYFTDSVSEVQLDEYLKRLSTSLPVTLENVRIIDKLEKVRCSVKTAIPIGIVTVELLTNSIKHAFEESEDCTIKLTMKVEDEVLKIRIKDNGSGFPDGFEPRLTDSMGIKLVFGIVESINGTIKIKEKKWTNVKINIPLEELEKN